jgi:KDO2-lipid IV(A) lauroyltransferase
MTALPEPRPPQNGAETGTSAANENEAGSLWRYAWPRYWPAWLFVGWLWLTAQLPWRFAIAVHLKLGRILAPLLSHNRRIVSRNLEICFPELTPAERDTLTRRYFESLGASLAEIAIAWFGRAPRSRPPIRVEGLEHLHIALAQGKGVILYSGHFTTLDLSPQVLKPLVPLFAFMYRRRNNPLLDAIQTRGRQRTAHVGFANTASRAMLRMLKQNAAVWYAADQAYFGKGAELLPFFGEPAMTNTATSRLARLSGAAVVPMHFYRLDGGAGYYVRFEPALSGVPSDDVREDTRVLTAVLERFIRESPEQYFWMHRKFKGRGPELPDVYARRAVPPAKTETHPTA